MQNPLSTHSFCTRDIRLVSSYTHRQICLIRRIFCTKNKHTNSKWNADRAALAASQHQRCWQVSEMLLLLLLQTLKLWHHSDIQNFHDSPGDLTAELKCHLCRPSVTHTSIPPSNKIKHPQSPSTPSYVLQHLSSAFIMNSRLSCTIWASSSIDTFRATM